MISDTRVADWDHALGLYVVGRVDASLSQLTNAIVAEKRAHQLRVVSIDSLVSLTEMMEDADVTHEDILTILRPGGPVVDQIVKLIARVTSESVATSPAAKRDTAAPSPPPGVVPAMAEALERLFLMTSVSDNEESPADAAIRSLLDQGWYVFGDRTPGRKRLKAGDRLCFYRSGTGVVAEAEVASAPERKPVKFVRDPERYPWAFQVKKVRYFFDTPVVIDAPLRSRLDAFGGRDPNKAWAWFVQATRVVTEHDFEALVGRG